LTGALAAAAAAFALSTIATSLGTSVDWARKAGPPMAQPTPTRIRLIPMMAMMVPVTTGGKKRSSLLTIGAISIETMPAPMIAPKIARAPSTPGIALAKATIGPTAAKVTPIITGSLMPNHRVTPRLWISVTTPQANRSAEISSATCSGVSLSARPTISGTAIAPAYITNTCCSPSVNSRPAGSRSSTGCTVVVVMRVSSAFVTSGP
jgi:hypothetical protein